jgi:ParB-like chromosome segregation protein Spo0J
MDFPHYKTSKVADLVPYARNSRTHSPQQVDKIAASIREFGFLNPVIVDGENGIIAGHGRIMAAQKLGIEEVPVIEASHLSDTQKRAYIIADNRLALDAGWDDEMLRVEFAELEEAGFDLELTGFTLDEIANVSDEPRFEPGTEDDQGKLDQLEPKWVDCPHCGKEFDLREQE